MSKKGEIEIESIVKRLKTIWPDINISVQHIRQPNSEFVLVILERFMETIGEDGEAHFRRVNKEIDKELYASLLPATRYCNVLKLILLNMQNPLSAQLTPGMLLNPTMKFTILLLKFVVNYVIFYSKLAKKFNGIRISYQNVSMEKEDVKCLEENVVMRRNNLAMSRSKFQKYKLEHEKNIEEMKHLLKENKEKKKKMENIRSTLESKKKMLLKDVQPKLERMANLENSIQNTRHLINFRHDNEKLKMEINDLREEDEFLTQTLKTKKSYETDLNIKQECDLFPETNDQTISSYENKEKLQVEIKKLKQKLNKFTTQAKNPQNKDKNSDIQKLEEKIALLEEKWQNKQKDCKKGIIKIQNDIDTIIAKANKIDNTNSPLQVELDNIRSENDELKNKEIRFTESCKENYQNILAQIKTTNETFDKVTANAKRRFH